MKNRTLTQKEVKKRVANTISEVVSNLFGMSNEAAQRELHTAFGEAMQDEQSLTTAALVYQLNKLIKAGLRGEGKPCTEEQLEMVLGQIKASAPEMASALRKGLKELQTRLPRHGGPGREGILNITEKREACEQVVILHKMGKIRKWSDIYESVAETFRAKGKQISGRTIKRVWETRERLYVG